MKIKTLIAELKKLDKEQEIKLYPKYATENKYYCDRLKQYKFEKRFIVEMIKSDGEEYVAILF